MPQIPLYNKGAGASPTITGTSLGSQVSSGAFTSVGQELAKFGEVAGNMMYEYYDADKKAEAKAASVEAETALDASLEKFNQESKVTNAEQYDLAFKAKSQAEIKKISSKYNLRKNEQKDLITRLNLAAAGKQQLGRREIAKKLDQKRGYQANTNLNLKMQQLSTDIPGTPLFEKNMKDVQSMYADAAQNGYLPYLDNKNIDEFNNKRENNSFLNSINAVTSVDAITEIENKIKTSKILTQTQKTTQLSRLKTKETAIINNTISEIVSSASIKQDFEGTDEDIVLSEVEALTNINAYLKGDFSSNARAGEKYKSLSVKDQSRVRQDLVALRKNEQIQIKWSENRRDEMRDENINNIVNDSTPKILTGQMSAKEIYNLNLPGTKGLAAKNTLLTIAENIVENKLPTKTDLTTYAFIEDAIANNIVTSPTQKFKVEGDTQALSLIERLSSEKGSISFDNYKILTGDIAKVKTTTGAKNLTVFKNFADQLKSTILGPSKFGKFNSEGNKRLYQWTVNMKANFNRGIEQGISAEDLVDPNSSNYIFTNQDFYIPTVEQVNAEIRNSINKSMGIPEREFKPEQIRVPVFDISNNTVTYFDDREKSTITLRGDDINPTTGKPNFKYKDLKDFKMNDPKFLNWSKTYGQIWRKQNRYSRRAYELWLKSN
jgi:hypothetical protein